MAISPASSLLRANQAYYGLLAETHTLEYGIAFFHPHWGDLPDAAQFREVVTSDPLALSAAYEEAEGFFFEQGMICRRWTPALDEPVGALAEFLEARGYRRRDVVVMALVDWPPRRAATDLRILPARPMREAYRATFAAEAATETLAQTQADAAIERLDSASLDVFVALDGQRPVGRGGVLQVGDIGRVSDVFVVPDARGRGFATAILTHVLNFTRRLAPRIICTEVDADNQVGIALLERCGFVRDRVICEFDRVSP